MLTPEEINRQLIIPAEDSSTPIKPNEAAFIYHFLKEKKLKYTLETGFGYARSASHIMAATNLPHIAMDPFQAHYNDIGLKNIQNLMLDNLLDFRREYSHVVLPQLLAENKKFDFIFIDGSHRFDGEFIDFYYSDLLLSQNGYILLHDTWMRTTQLVMNFINTNRVDYVAIPTPLRNFALYQKIGTDNRNGMYHNEFYTIKSFITHYTILWLTTGENTWLKKQVFKLKEALK